MRKNYIPGSTTRGQAALVLAAAALLATPAIGIAGGAGKRERPTAKTGAKLSGPKLTALKLRDAEGRAHSLAEFADRKVVVVAFTGTQCPISNGYAETLSQLSDRFKSRGVQFLAVNAIREETATQVGRHAREYRLTFPAWKDAGQALADALGAKVTPEVFVLDGSRAVRYQGRIDDRYASRARQRSQITTHDLEVALEAVLTGKPVQVASTAAFGCAIVRPSTASPSGDARVTYYRDVAPILHERCQSCHRPGQIAPFSLASYADARNWATEIKTFTGNRQMPPWKAEPGHGEFSDVRRLSDQEVETLAAWADAGAPAGNIKDAPAPKQWPSNWALGEPDLVLKMPEAYQVSAGGKDDFRCFVLPTNLPEDKQVVAVEVRPGNPRVVHHVLNFLDIRGAARKLDERDPLPGYNSGLGGIGIQPSGALGGWAPGNLPRFLPEGVGLPLPKGADVVLQVHYHKTGKPETDQTMIGIHFAKKPIEKRLRTWPLTTLAINIPPGEARHEVRSQMMLPFDVHALGITPHMHLLGREMKVTATLPDGTEKSLVWIKDWDYRWQDTYRYQEPVALPRGTRLNLVAYYDNSTGNPLNPSSPPQRVTFGEETTDEMCFAFIGFTMDREPPGGGRLGGAFGLF